LLQQSPKRLGILGGTFDPVHLGHIKLAELALAQAELDELILVPCHLPPHRDAVHASPEDRLAMVRLTVSAHAEISVSDFELNKSSTSYTVETLVHFHNEFPGAELFFCLGGDSLAQVKSWHQWQAILELANLVVLEREHEHAELDDEIVSRIISPAGLTEKPAGQILQLTAPRINVSASEVRRHLMNTGGGQDVDDYLQRWLHPDVLKYIKEHQVYA
jgi:nicotinate-nucleotide adenylyltransferase